MSAKAVGWAKQQAAGSSTAKLVLLLLAEHYNEAWGRAWPSRATIAAAAELDVKSVSRSLDKLEDAGLVTRELWMREDGARLGNRYYLPRHRPDVALEGMRGRPVVVRVEWDHRGRQLIERASDSKLLYEGPDR